MSKDHMLYMTGHNASTMCLVCKSFYDAYAECSANCSDGDICHLCSLHHYHLSCFKNIFHRQLELYWVRTCMLAMKLYWVILYIEMYTLVLFLFCLLIIQNQKHISPNILFYSYYFSF
jgi:uncharacterized integral membrane protein